MIPVRCFSCNKVIANVYEKYKKLVETNLTENEIFEILKITRYCCKRMIISAIETDIY